jgi:hypothetical protein
LSARLLSHKPEVEDALPDGVVGFDWVGGGGRSGCADMGNLEVQ